MTTASTTASPSTAHAWVGRTFLHPALDYLLIGGGLSVLFTAGLVLSPGAIPTQPVAIANLLLVSNMAHFASSTVRLYTKPGATEAMPGLTLAFPAICLLVLTLCITFAGSLGPHLQRLYLSWSPYHYAAQAFGLSVMYCYRSGCRLSPADKRLLRWASLFVFFRAFISTPGVGLQWIVPPEVLGMVPQSGAILEVGATLLSTIALLAPIALFLKLRRSASPMPLIVPLLLISNGLWWIALPPLNAFVWATIFHGIQYLAIVIIFHVRDQMAQPGNTRGALTHAVRFYAMSLVLGYALFRVLPEGFAVAGFGRVESLLLVVAAINIHHFVVDAFIWRVSGGDSRNSRIVEATAAS